MTKKLQNIFSALTLFGTPFFYLPVTIVLAVFNLALALRLLIILLSVEALCCALKFIYPKERPIPLPRKTLYQKYEAGSFPSIHAARIAVVAAFLSFAYPSAATVAAGFLATLLVGYSRIYLRKHYIIDVLVGIAIGVVLGVLLK